MTLRHNLLILLNLIMNEIIKNTLNKDYLYMGIDFGIKKIGFAIGQIITTKTTPLKIINNYNNKINWTEIHNIIENWKPNVIVIGYPYSKKKGGLLKKLDKFIEDLNDRYKDSIQILTFSEVLSTEESKIIYNDMRKSNYKISQKVNLDDLSASIILQSWFNENMVN